MPDDKHTQDDRMTANATSTSLMDEETFHKAIGPGGDTPHKPVSRGALAAMLAALVILATALVVAVVAVLPGNEESFVLAGNTSPEAGDLRTIDLGDGVTLDLVYVAPGTFRMGSPAGLDTSVLDQETLDLTTEFPQHEVEITEGFWLGRFEVTNEQFRRFRPDHASGSYRDHTLNNNLQPAVMLSWHDATAFCEWLSRETGLGVRLPTDAEWEYACRAGSESLFAHGDTPASLQGFANAMGPAAKHVLGISWTTFPFEDGLAVSGAVGSFAPNAWGLYDMQGNAWEWCQDWFDRDYYAQSPTKDPQGPETGQYKVLRGGSWSDSPTWCRAAFRLSKKPTRTRPYDGFRIAITAGGAS